MENGERVRTTGRIWTIWDISHRSKMLSILFAFVENAESSRQMRKRQCPRAFYYRARLLNCLNLCVRLNVQKKCAFFLSFGDHAIAPFSSLVLGVIRSILKIRSRSTKIPVRGNLLRALRTSFASGFALLCARRMSFSNLLGRCQTSNPWRSEAKISHSIQKRCVRK